MMRGDETYEASLSKGILTILFAVDQFAPLRHYGRSEVGRM